MTCWSSLQDPCPWRRTVGADNNKLLGTANHLLLWNPFDNFSSEGKLSFNSKARIPARLISKPAIPHPTLLGAQVDREGNCPGYLWILYFT